MWNSRVWRLLFILFCSLAVIIQVTCSLAAYMAKYSINKYIYIYIHMSTIKALVVGYVMCAYLTCQVFTLPVGLPNHPVLLSALARAEAQQSRFLQAQPSKPFTLHVMCASLLLSARIGSSLLYCVLALSRL